MLWLVTKRVLLLESAVTVAREAEQWLAGHEYSVVSSQVLSLAVQAGCLAKDCESVAMAKDLRVPWSQRIDRFSRHSLL